MAFLEHFQRNGRAKYTITVAHFVKEPKNGILWHIVAYCGILWHIVAYYGILWHIMAHCGILWHIVAYYGTLWHIMAYCGCSELKRTCPLEAHVLQSLSQKGNNCVNIATFFIIAQVCLLHKYFLKNAIIIILPLPIKTFIAKKRVQRTLIYYKENCTKNFNLLQRKGHKEDSFLQSRD